MEPEVSLQHSLIQTSHNGCVSVSVCVCVCLCECVSVCVWVCVCVWPRNLKNEVVLRSDLGRSTTNKKLCVANSAQKIPVSSLSLLKKNNNRLKNDQRLPSRI